MHFTLETETPSSKLLELVRETLCSKGRKWKNFFYFHSCPNCSPRDKAPLKVDILSNLWECESCGVGGSIVDFMWAKIGEGFTRSEAALKAHLWLNKEQQPATDKQKALERVIKLIQERAVMGNPECAKYLSGRAIPEHVQMQAWERGMLRFLPSNPHQATKWLCENIGHHMLERAGLWGKNVAMPEIAFRPVIFLTQGCNGVECHSTDALEGEHEGRPGIVKNSRFSR